MVGYTDSIVKQKFNLGNSASNLVFAVITALLVAKFRRRAMYLACTISLLICYICWTISMQQSIVAIDAGRENYSTAIATLFFIFTYSPCYNIGYNALTYSKFPSPVRKPLADMMKHT